jgi:two-component system C4-dicarboxylate transport sensor histidine kinase DctB
MPVFPRFRLFTALALIALIALLLWLSHFLSWKNGLDELRNSSGQQLEQFIGHLDSQLARFAFLPRLIAQNQRLVDLLKHPHSSPRVDVVNHFLEEINDITGASATYLMDADGLTLAASNWQSENPFVGKNFSFRPYFTAAMQGESGRYFALGTTSARRGYYFSYPILYAADIIGVVVIKMDLSNIEQRWSNRDNQFIVTDDDGVIFITTRPDWLFRNISNISPQTRRDIANSRRYADTQIKPLDLQPQQTLAAGGKILRLQQLDYLSLQQAMPEAGWRVMILAPLKDISSNAVVNISLLLLVLLIVLLIGLLSWQRYKRRQEHERFQLEAQRQLERKVRERTQDLTHEIDEHKRTEKELRETQDELIQTAKLAVLGQMSASISHELNNPLAAIRSYADNARQFLKLEKTDKADENLGRIGSLTERMARISSQLKAFARKSSGKLEAVKIASVVQSTLDIVNPQLKHSHINIDTGAIDKNLSIMADPIQLEQVLINLINNAINAIDPQHGEIHIKTEQQQEWIMIHVEDNGPGISDENLDKIFNPFFTTRKSGLGLGLSISARILDSMSGHLSASNLEHGGARFSIALGAAT